MKITEAGDFICCGRVISWRDNEEFPEDTGNAVGFCSKCLTEV